jgi:hypothetical protein
MPSYIDEVKANFQRFTAAYLTELSSVQASISNHEDIFVESYQFLTSINVWRELIIKNRVAESAYAFFVEAHNDAVSSHAFARMGSWRAALKSLRSCIENVLFCEYYKDHPVELRLWDQGKHKISFSETMNYFDSHPDISDLPTDFTDLPRLQREYGTLSRAVHGSAPSFRMTGDDGFTNLWICDVARIGSWHTREHAVILCINYFLLSLYRELLQGAQFPGLRQAIGLCLNSQHHRDKVRDTIGVNIPELS